MKKIIIIVAMFISVFMISGCTNKRVTEDSLSFKAEYEGLNGKVNSDNIEYRTVSINEENPFEYISPEDLVEEIEEKETFYVYFGDTMCPWCRSSIEKAIETAAKYKINKIYYVKIWDDEHNEILRDKYEVKKGKAVKVVEGTEAYKKLLKYFDNVLSDYAPLTYVNKKGKEKKIEIDEKRIYAPNYIYVKDGKAIKLVTGTSDKMENPYDELTDEVLKDQEKQFTELFEAK